MIKQANCSNCSILFSYSDSDSQGKFCSRKCHYDSKNLMDTCKNCGKEFRKRSKDPRKTCSNECYKLRRSMKSKDMVTQEVAKSINFARAGQTSIPISDRKTKVLRLWTKIKNMIVEWLSSLRK